MTFQHAIDFLAGHIEDDNEYTYELRTGHRMTIDAKQMARATVVEAVAELAKTDTDHLDEWVADGDYQGDETAESIAAEWDALSA